MLECVRDEGGGSEVVVASVRYCRCDQFHQMDAAGPFTSHELDAVTFRQQPGRLCWALDAVQMHLAS